MRRSRWCRMKIAARIREREIESLGIVLVAGRELISTSPSSRGSIWKIEEIWPITKTEEARRMQEPRRKSIAGSLDKSNKSVCAILHHHLAKGSKQMTIQICFSTQTYLSFQAKASSSNSPAMNKWSRTEGKPTRGKHHKVTAHRCRSLTSILSCRRGY